MTMLLLSNDDGVHAPGLQELRKVMQQMGLDTRTVAPNTDRSGASNSLSLDRPLTPVHVNDHTISLDGTPTDCVHLGLYSFYRDQCSRVVSGINSGANLGDDVLYSGTVAAAMEGRYLDQTPIAISLCGKTHFDTAGRVLKDVFPRLTEMALPRHSVISINVPDVPYDQIEGIEITRLGHRHKADKPVAITNPRGKESFWISSAGEVADAGVGTDFYAIEHNRVSITPLHIDMTLHSSMMPMNEKLGFQKEFK